MNIVILSGKVAKIYQNSDTHIKIIIAEHYADKTDFIGVTMFENTAKAALKYLEIGDHISIEGRVSTYKGNDNKEYTTIIANRFNWEGYKNPKKQIKESQQSNNQDIGFVQLDNSDIEDLDTPF